MQAAGHYGVTFETATFRIVLGADAVCLHFIDKAADTDYCNHDPMHPVACLTKDGLTWRASAASVRDGLLHLEFAGTGVSASVRIEERSSYLVMTVESVDGDGVEELVLVDVSLALKEDLEEPFAACALALNLQTNVVELPGPNARLRAACCPRFGFVGASVALIGCPQDELRSVMKRVLAEAPDLPHSLVGGPWALDEPTNLGSYLFNFGLTEETVDDWITTAKALGFEQIDFHGGTSFRFGDCRPNPEMYPQGLTSLKAVIDRLHAAGTSHVRVLHRPDMPLGNSRAGPKAGEEGVFHTRRAAHR